MSEFAEDRGKRNWRRSTWIAGLFVLSMALAAKQLIGESGLVDTLAQSGSLLAGIGIAADLASRKTGRPAYRAALLLTVVSILLLGWVSAAVGIIGSEDNTLNLMYVAVLGVAVVGVILARFKPRGMSRALYTTAVAQGVVAAIATAERLGTDYSAAFEVVAINGFFVAMFVGSAVLFSRAVEHRYGPPLV